MKDTKEAIMERLQKLIAMQGEGAVNANEMATANKLMKKLMQKYDIEMHQLEKIKSKQSNVSQENYDTGYKCPRIWVKLLASTLANFYDCKVIRGRGIFYFMGFDIDRKVCVQIFDYLYWAIYHAGENESNSSEANDFRNGAVYGLSKRLNLMKEELKKEMVNESSALIVLKESEIAAFSADIHKHVQSEGVSSGNLTEGFFNGMKYGKQVSLNQQVEGK